MNDTAWTILGLLKWGERYFKSKGIEPARLNIETLLSETLNKKRLDLYLEFETELNKETLAELKAKIQRRASGEPLQYITGKVSFHNLELFTNAPVLIPRPETEFMVENLILAIKELFGVNPMITILDLCTGSGCIALALAREFPNASITATDISLQAVSLAEKNRANLRIPNARFIQENLYTARQDEVFDVIVSNPPYIRTDDLPFLQKEVRDYEDRAALDGGQDGMQFHKSIINVTHRFLKRPGIFCLETGEDQASSVGALCFQVFSGAKKIECLKDYAGKFRVVLTKLL